jgi:cytochrome b561
LPLALVTGSAEFRYLHWSVIAALLAMLAAFTARQRASSDNSAYEHS